METSIFIKKIKMLPRKVSSWIKFAPNCFKCNSTFNWYIWKHHCRSCGRIFCGNCSNFSAVLNQEYENYPIETIEEGHMNLVKRVCFKCFKRNSQINKIWDTFQWCLFTLQLNLLELKLFSKTSHVWYQVYNYYIYKFRELQYQLPNYKLNKYEIKMLYNNRHIVVNHNKYYLQLLKNVNNLQTEIPAKKIVSCAVLNCNEKCQPKLTPFEVIDYFMTLSKEKEKERIISPYYINYFIFCFSEISDSELYCILPIMRQLFPDLNVLFKNYLLNRIENNQRTKLEWDWNSTSSRTGNDAIILELIKKIGKKSSTQEIINDLDILSYDKSKSTFNIPLFPHTKFKDIDFHNISVKQSYTNPVVIPLISTTDNVHTVLYKNTNVMKDKIITNLIRLIDIFLSNNNIDLNIQTYNVFPILQKPVSTLDEEDDSDWNDCSLSKTPPQNSNVPSCEPQCKSGLIEYINDAETICNINMKKNFSIQNYIIEHNPTKSVDELRKRFINSVAGYCIITFLLGIGDRHWDNIMITNSGSLFHIDFDYILGNDSKPGAPMIRITSSMIDAMGGKNSKYYEEFKRKCISAYECIRVEYSIIMNMLSLICPTDKDICSLEKHIVNRFLPGQTEYEAKIEISTRLNETDTYSQRIFDLLHYYKKTI